VVEETEDTGDGVVKDELVGYEDIGGGLNDERGSG
jgi:hypothetical protein